MSGDQFNPASTLPQRERRITGKAAPPPIAELPRKSAEETTVGPGAAIILPRSFGSFLTLSSSLPALPTSILPARYLQSRRQVAVPSVAMSLSAGLSLPLRRMTVSNSLPSTFRFSQISSRAFSTTLHRDATWGFIGLGQMGMSSSSVSVFRLPPYCRRLRLHPPYCIPRGMDSIGRRDRNDSPFRERRRG